MSATTFQYRAIDRAGTRCKGEIPASSDQDAFRKLTVLGLTPLAIAPSGGRSIASPARQKIRGGRIRPKDLAHFTYQLGVLVGSRIPLSEGLRSIAEQEPKASLRSLIADVARRVESGEQIAQALEAHRTIFGEVYIQTIRAAEHSGNLPKALEHLTESMERGQEMTAQVRGAMMYPLCVLSVLGLAVTFLVGFVVPRFARMFEQRSLPLPAITRALMTFGLSIQVYWYLYLAGIVIVSVLFHRGWHKPVIRTRLDALFTRIPYIGAILQGLALARFSRVLGLSLSSGIGLLDAIELSAAASGQSLLRRDAESLAAAVRRGGMLSDSLPDCPSLSPFTRRMLIAGERSAELPRMCGIIARHYERETSQLVKNIATFIEPVLIVLIAGVVLFVALAIFLPMWDMVKLLG